MADMRIHTLGGRIWFIREQRGLSRAQAAERIGISKGYLYRIEVNMQRPSIPILHRIADKLDVRWEDLVYRPKSSPITELKLSA